jgi:glutathione S-transferase
MKTLFKKFTQNQPNFFEFLGNQDPSKDKILVEKIETFLKFFTENLDPKGPFYLGANLTTLDINVSPIFYRMFINWKHYRNYDVYSGTEPWR